MAIGFELTNQIKISRWGRGNAALWEKTGQHWQLLFCASLVRCSNFRLILWGYSHGSIEDSVIEVGHEYVLTEWGIPIYQHWCVFVFIEDTLSVCVEGDHTMHKVLLRNGDLGASILRIVELTVCERIQGDVSNACHGAGASLGLTKTTGNVYHDGQETSRIIMHDVMNDVQNVQNCSFCCVPMHCLNKRFKRKI